MRVLEWKTNRDTVTVAVLFMYPTLDTWPTRDIGGMAGNTRGRAGEESVKCQTSGPSDSDECEAEASWPMGACFS